MKMDSPESSKPPTTNCETAPVQDSPVFSFISNLSPIQPVRTAPVTQGFPELNSPPLVFTSPRLNRHRQSTFLKRAQFPRASAANLSGQGYEKLNIQLSTRLDVCNEKCSDSNSPEIHLTESPTGCPEQFLTDIVNVDSDDTKFSNNSTSKKTECENNSRTSKQIETDEVQVLEGVTLIDQVDNETKQGDGVFVDHCPGIECELPVGHALTNRAKEDSVTESVEAEQAARSDQSYHLLSGSMESGKENETLTEPVLLKVQNDREAFQHRGVRRRCLQFGDAQNKIISNQSTQITSECEGLRSPSLETSSIPIKIPKPSGIGLHLNSIVNAVQTGPSSKVNVRSSQWGNFSIVGKKSMPVNEPHPSDYSNSSSSILPLVESVSAIIDDNRHENHASAGVTSAMSMPTYSVTPSNDSIVYNSLGDQSTPGNKRKCIENVVGSEEFNKSSPPKKRMKSSEPSDVDGCKRCNCKKSKCLKLYCDCFAAGIYCADPCACQECFNKPEYEDMVLETRQKIESRDPLAFAPRVVKRVTEQPSSSLGEDVTTNFTPSSARHKRGCKCKKSMCLKKYCECYQSNVGCSDGCRCEGCQNVFGRKGEICPIKDVFSEEDPNEAANAILEKCEMKVSGNGINHTDLFNAHNLTPPTPGFQFSNHGKDASKAWFSSGENSQSPEPDLTYMAPYMISPGSPINSDNNNDNDLLSSEHAQDILLDLASFDYDSHTPDLQKWADNSKPKPISEKRQLYPQEGGGSLGWRGSPNTPVPQFSGTKLIRDVEFDVELSNSVQDETPEILKDDSTPVNAVKVCSPNKKRVSPPHVLRPHEFGSGSLTGLRTGRKFILKAVPSFPPLTPCTDSRSVAVQQTNDNQDRSVKK